MKIILLLHAHGGTFSKGTGYIVNITGMDERTAKRSIKSLCNPKGNRPIIIDVKKLAPTVGRLKNVITLRGYSIGEKPTGIYTIEDILDSFQKNFKIISRDFSRISVNVLRNTGNEMRYKEWGDAEQAQEIQKIFNWLKEKKAKVNSLDKFIHDWIIRAMAAPGKAHIGPTDVPEEVSYVN